MYTKALLRDSLLKILQAEGLKLSVNKQKQEDKKMYTNKDYILGGVADAHLFAGNDLFCNAITTLTDSGLNITISPEEVRGGKGAALLGRYFHSTGLNLTLTNATFNMAYIAAAVGADIESGAEVMMDEQIVASTAGQLIPSKTIVPMNGCANGDKAAWFKKADVDEPYKKANEIENNMIKDSAIEVNATYCVKYFYNNAAGNTITVKSDFVPKTLHLILDANLYAVGDNAADGQTNVGKVVIDVPAFQLNGNQDITMNMTGAATINMEGTALAVKTCDAGCAGGKYYAKIIEVIDNAVWFDGIKTIAVDGGKATAGKDAALYAIFENKAPQKITATMLTDNALQLKIDDTVATGITIPANITTGAHTLKLVKGEDEVATGNIYVEAASQE